MGKYEIERPVEGRGQGREKGRREPDKTKLFFFNLFPPGDGMIAARVNTGQASVSVSNDCNHTEQTRTF